MCSPHVRHSIQLHLLEEEYVHKLLGILLHKRFVFSLINLFSYWSISIQIYECLLSLRFIILFLFIKIVPALAIESFFSWLLCPFNIIPWLFFLRIFYFMAHDVSGSACRALTYVSLLRTQCFPILHLGFSFYLLQMSEFHTDIHIHIHVYMYICVPIRACVYYTYMSITYI